MSGRHPDESALPKKQLETASQLVFNRPGDAALRYGFGLGLNPFETGSPSIDGKWKARM